MSILEVKNLKKNFGSLEVLKGIDFSLEKGEALAMIGASGSGKTTLLRCLNFLERPTHGQIIVNNKVIFDADDNKSLGDAQIRKNRLHFGMVFQSFNLFPQYTALRNCTLARELMAKERPDFKENKKKIMDEITAEGEALLESVGLKEKMNYYPHQLSGGQQQRVAIARALATSPKILLCDEATSALDPQTTASILELLQEINRKFNITIVIITHQMSVVRKICSHVAIMKSGEIVETGSVSEIFSHPKSDVARELIRKDEGDDISRAESSGNTKDLIQSGRKVRIVFSENSAFQPVIANMILKFREPVNILRADTRNIGGVAKGEMILEFAGDSRQAEEMQNYLKTCGIELEEVTDDVE